MVKPMMENHGRKVKKKQHQAIQKLLLFKCTQNDFKVDRSSLNERANDVKKKKRNTEKNKLWKIQMLECSS